MITIKSIRYFILAGLIVALPTHPMGWFNTTWKKVGVGVAAVAAVVGIMYGIKRYKNYKRRLVKELASAIEYNPESVEFLINRGAPVNSNQYHEYYDDPLVIAISNGMASDKIIMMLIKHGSNVNRQRTAEHMLIPNKVILETPLLTAAFRGFPNIVELLLEHGADINVTTHFEPDPRKGFSIKMSKSTVYNYAEYNNEETRTALIKLLDDHRRKVYVSNTKNISAEIFKHSEKIKNLSKDITDIMGEYAAEYPLVNERPLEFGHFVQIQEQQDQEPSTVQQRNPLSLDENA